MALERAVVTWDDGERFYFLSPDGDEWLEVTADTYHRSRDHEASVVRQLRAKLDGSAGFMPIRATRGYLQMFGARPGFLLTFD